MGATLGLGVGVGTGVVDGEWDVWVGGGRFTLLILGLGQPATPFIRANCTVCGAELGLKYSCCLY